MTSRVVGLIPSGTINRFTLEVLSGHIQGLLSLPVDILPEWEPPKSCFNEVRSQYHAAQVLQLLSEEGPSCFRVLGVTSYDLFLPIFTHVYGEAQLPGKAAVVSLFRLEASGEGKPADRETFLLRAAKVAIHELLHTFGMVHCTHTDCLMRSVTKIRDLDTLPLYLCRACNGYKDELVRVSGKEEGLLVKVDAQA